MGLKDIYNYVVSVFKALPNNIKSVYYRTEGTRSPKWQAFRNKLVKNGKCAICGTANSLSLHHKKPFHLFPELELDEKNLVILCESPSHNCHFIFGHMMNWSMYNHDLDNTVAYFQLLMKTAKMNLQRESIKSEV
jgi:hypothetical protein